MYSLGQTHSTVPLAVRAEQRHRAETHPWGQGGQVRTGEDAQAGRVGCVPPPCFCFTCQYQGRSLLRGMMGKSEVRMLGHREDDRAQAQWVWRRAGLVSFVPSLCQPLLGTQ